MDEAVRISYVTNRDCVDGFVSCSSALIEITSYSFFQDA
jgi:hypothetical protein